MVWHREVANIFCMFEKKLPMSFMDLQAHILINLLDEIELARVLLCCWMFFLERYMKKLKCIIQQRKKLEGSMEEGYIVCESFYYASEYIKQIDDIEGAFICYDHQDEDKREGEILQTNGKRWLIKSKSIIFCQFSREKLFTLKLIIYISSHPICFEFFYTSMNLEILMPSIKNSLS
jgi:hypothetical protein